MDMLATKTINTHDKHTVYCDDCGHRIKIGVPYIIYKIGKKICANCYKLLKYGIGVED